MKGFDCGFIPKRIDTKMEGQWVKLWTRAIEEKSCRDALAGKSQIVEEEDDDMTMIEVVQISHMGENGQPYSARKVRSL